MGAASEVSSLDIEIRNTLPVAPQSYDRYGGAVIEPFAQSVSERISRRKRWMAKRRLVLRKREKMRMVRRKKITQRTPASQLLPQKVKRDSTKEPSGGRLRP